MLCCVFPYMIFMNIIVNLLNKNLINLFIALFSCSENPTTESHRWRKIVGSRLGVVKPKTIKLVFVASIHVQNLFSILSNVQNLFRIFNNVHNLFRIFSNVQNLQNLFRIFRICSEFLAMFRIVRICSEFSAMLRICSEFPVMFRICSEFSAMFRICSEFSVMFRICSEFSAIFRIYRICSESVHDYITLRLHQFSNVIDYITITL